MKFTISAAVFLGALLAAAPTASAQTDDPLKDPAVRKVRDAFRVETLALLDVPNPGLVRGAACATNPATNVTWCATGTSYETTDSGAFTKQLGYHLDSKGRVVHAAFTRREYPLERAKYDDLLKSLGARYGGVPVTLTFQGKTADGDEFQSLIAVWGGIKLVRLNDAEFRAVAAGGTAGRGPLIDHRQDPRASAQRRDPVFRIEGSAGYIVQFRSVTDVRTDIVQRVVYLAGFADQPPGERPEPQARTFPLDPAWALHAERARIEEERQAAIERARREEDERKAAEARRIEEERKAAAEKARREEEERQAAIERARREEDERKAAEARRIEEERKAAEDKARRAEEERQAAAERARAEAERKAAEEKARVEAERKAAAERARAEAERKAAAERARAEAERKAAEEKARIEAERRAAEERARAEAERKAAEEKARAEAERKAAEERRAMEERARRAEAEYKAAVERARRAEAERAAAEERARQAEADRKAAEDRAKRLDMERKAAEDRIKREDNERKAAEERTRAIAEEKRQEEARRIAAERARLDELERRAAAERARVEELERRAASERAGREDAQRKSGAARAEEERRAAEERARRADVERRRAEDRHAGADRPLPRPMPDRAAPERPAPERPAPERNVADVPDQSKSDASAAPSREAWLRTATARAKASAVPWVFNRARDRISDDLLLQAQAVFTGGDRLAVEIAFECNIDAGKRLKAFVRAFDARTKASLRIPPEDGQASVVRGSVTLDEDAPQTAFIFPERDERQASIVEVPVTHEDVRKNTARAQVWLRHYQIAIKLRLPQGEATATIFPYDESLRRVLDGCVP